MSLQGASEYHGIFCGVLTQDGSSGLTMKLSSELNSTEEEDHSVTGHRYPEKVGGGCRLKPLV